MSGMKMVIKVADSNKPNKKDKLAFHCVEGPVDGNFSHIKTFSGGNFTAAIHDE